MKRLSKVIREDKIIYRSFISTIFLVVATVSYSALSYSKLPPIIPLFNQLPWGEERLANSILIFLPPCLVLLILAVNSAITIKVYSKAPLLGRIIMVTAFLTGVFTLLLVARAITIVT